MKPLRSLRPRQLHSSPEPGAGPTVDQPTADAVHEDAVLIFVNVFSAQPIKDFALLLLRHDYLRGGRMTTSKLAADSRLQPYANKS